MHKLFDCNPGTQRSALATFAQEGHEYSPGGERVIIRPDARRLKDDKPVDLRSLMKGKKLVRWCTLPVVRKLA